MFDSIEFATNTINGMYAKGVLKNRLSQLRIHSFRRFAKESELNFTFPLTVIVGKNGSGKTTVMKAIKLLSNHQIPQSEFFETVIDDGGFPGPRRGREDYQFSSHKICFMDEVIFT